LRYPLSPPIGHISLQPSFFSTEEQQLQLLTELQTKYIKENTHQKRHLIANTIRDTLRYKERSLAIENPEVNSLPDVFNFIPNICDLTINCPRLEKLALYSNQHTKLASLDLSKCTSLKDLTINGVPTSINNESLKNAIPTLSNIRLPSSDSNYDLEDPLPPIDTGFEVKYKPPSQTFDNTESFPGTGLSFAPPPISLRNWQFPNQNHDFLGDDLLHLTSEFYSLQANDPPIDNVPLTLGQLENVHGFFNDGNTCFALSAYQLAHATRLKNLYHLAENPLMQSYHGINYGSSLIGELNKPPYNLNLELGRSDDAWVVLNALLGPQTSDHAMMLYPFTEDPTQPIPFASLIKSNLLAPFRGSSSHLIVNITKDNDFAPQIEDIPEVLDLNAYEIEPSGNTTRLSETPTFLMLQGFIEFIPNSTNPLFSHYVAYFRNSTPDDPLSGPWIKADDQSVREVTQDEVDNALKGATILYYEGLAEGDINREADNSMMEI